MEAGAARRAALAADPGAPRGCAPPSTPHAQEARQGRGAKRRRKKKKGAAARGGSRQQLPLARPSQYSRPRIGARGGTAPPPAPQTVREQSGGGRKNEEPPPDSSGGRIGPAWRPGGGSEREATPRPPQHLTRARNTTREGGREMPQEDRRGGGQRRSPAVATADAARPEPRLKRAERRHEEWGGAVARDSSPQQRAPGRPDQHPWPRIGGAGDRRRLQHPARAGSRACERDRMSPNDEQGSVE